MHPGRRGFELVRIPALRRTLAHVLPNRVALFASSPCSLGGVDLRWVKILRSMRVLRVGLLSGELRSLHLRWVTW